METKEIKINKRDMKFLATYAETYYPISDEIYDIEGAIKSIEGYEKAQAVLIKDRDRMKDKIKKGRMRLNALKEKYGEKRVVEIVREWDGYSN